MIKQEATNTFLDGMLMDFNPLVTPNSVMTSCLNGTIITYNGNENVLLNDMGNGRVETAYLPEGYIPLGTCELGGIIYIVSYNPLEKTCLIGSFPSPERNITSGELDSLDLNSLKIILSINDFQWSEEDGAGIYYLKKDLDPNITFLPGDKFIVYSSNIQSNIGKLNGLSDNIKDETVKLSLGTITSDGKLVKFDADSLKKFKIGSKDYHIKEFTSSQGNKPSSDLDDYRSLTSLPYNIFNSKVSGTLVLIAELVQFDSFNIEINHHINKAGGVNKYEPYLICDFSGDYEYVPYGVIVKTTLVGLVNSETNTYHVFKELNGGLSHSITIKNFLEKSLESLNNNNYFSNNDRELLTLNYEIIPCMNWGLVKHLAIKGSIALDKIGTGYINLNTWKYYNSQTKSNLTWGLEVYEEDDKEVKDVEMTFTRLVSSDVKESITYEVERKQSYHGTFYDLIPFDSPYYKFKDDKILYPNLLYLVKITVKYGSKDSTDDRTKDTTDDKVFYRWYYTSSVFNEYYGNTLDFKDLQISFKPKLNLQYSSEVIKDTPVEYLGAYFGAYPGYDISSDRSLCALKNTSNINTQCSAKIVLDNDYNMFNLKTDLNSFSITSISKDKFDVISTIKYTNIEDGNMEYILSNLVSDSWTEPDWPSSATNFNDSKQGLFYGDDAVHKNCYKIVTPNPTITYKDGTFTFNILSKMIGIAKAYSSLENHECSSRGKFIPLAYDNDTFYDYNLMYDSFWKPAILGTFAFKEEKNKKGNLYLGYITSDGSYYENNFREEVESVNFDWTNDSNILEAQDILSWKKNIMFVTHHGCTKSDPRQKWWDRSRRNGTYENGLKSISSSQEVFSWDSYHKPDTYNGKSTGDYGHLVLIAVKSNNDDYYYPLNCGVVGNLRTDVDSIRLEYFKLDNTNGTTGLFKNFYAITAKLLNNLYRFVPERDLYPYLIPGDIYYGDNYKYDITVKINYTYNRANNEIQVKLDNGYLDLSSVANGLIGTISSLDLVNNILYNISSLDINESYLTMSLKDNQSGVNLRNKLLAALNINLGISLYGYDGKTFLTFVPDSSPSSKYIYCVLKSDDGYSVLYANSFKIRDLLYTLNNNLLTVEDSNTYTGFISENINGLFLIDDYGKLVINNPQKSEHTFKKTVTGDNGTVKGYSKRGLIKLYILWK